MHSTLRTAKRPKGAALYLRRASWRAELPGRLLGAFERANLPAVAIRARTPEARALRRRAGDGAAEGQAIRMAKSDAGQRCTEADFDGGVRDWEALPIGEDILAPGERVEVDFGPEVGIFVATVKRERERKHHRTWLVQFDADGDEVLIYHSFTNYRRLSSRKAPKRKTAPAAAATPQPTKKATSKHRGVCWNTQKQKWMSKITVDGQQHFLGLFGNESKAAEAYAAACRRFGRDPNAPKPSAALSKKVAKPPSPKPKPKPKAAGAPAPAPAKARAAKRQPKAVAPAVKRRPKAKAPAAPDGADGAGGGDAQAQAERPAQTDAELARALAAQENGLRARRSSPPQEHFLPATRSEPGVQKAAKKPAQQKAAKKPPTREPYVVAADGVKHEVEGIVGRRNAADGTEELLLKWTGYSDAENTWEPRSAIVGGGKLIREYQQRLPVQLAERSRHAQPAERKTSAYLGVTWRPDKSGGGKWQVECHRVYVGRFADERAAAMAYDAECVKQRGANAVLNFPGRAKQNAKAAPAARKRRVIAPDAAAAAGTGNAKKARRDPQVQAAMTTQVAEVSPEVSMYVSGWCVNLPPSVWARNGDESSRAWAKTQKPGATFQCQVRTLFVGGVGPQMYWRIQHEDETPFDVRTAEIYRYFKPAEQLRIDKLRKTLSLPEPSPAADDAQTKKSWVDATVQPPHEASRHPMQLSQVLASEGGPIGAPSAGRGGRGGGGARGRGRARGRGTTAGGGVILGPFGGAASAPQEAKEGAVGELTAPASSASLIEAVPVVPPQHGPSGLEEPQAQVCGGSQDSSQDSSPALAAANNVFSRAADMRPQEDSDFSWAAEEAAEPPATDVPERSEEPQASVVEPLDLQPGPAQQHPQWVNAPFSTAAPVTAVASIVAHPASAIGAPAKRQLGTLVGPVSAFSLTGMVG